jgi:hypothetical protein
MALLLIGIDEHEGPNVSDCLPVECRSQDSQGHGDLAGEAGLHRLIGPEQVSNTVRSGVTTTGWHLEQNRREGEQNRVDSKWDLSKSCDHQTTDFLLGHQESKSLETTCICASHRNLPKPTIH